MNTMNHNTKKRFEAVKADMAKGMVMVEACKKNNMSPVTFRKHSGVAKKSKVIHIPETTNNDFVVAFYGPPKMIAETVRNLQ